MPERLLGWMERHWRLVVLLVWLLACALFLALAAATKSMTTDSSPGEMSKVRECDDLIDSLVAIDTKFLPSKSALGDLKPESPPCRRSLTKDDWVLLLPREER